MKSKRNKKSSSKKVATALICIIVLGLFSLVYAMLPTSNTDSDVAYRIKDIFNGESVIEDLEKDAVVPVDKPNKGNPKPQPPIVEEPETEVPTISIEDINPEPKDDPNYITFDFNITDATYTVEEDGKLVEKPFPNMKGGTISIPKEQSSHIKN